jgi:hypothetical protein
VRRTYADDGDALDLVGEAGGLVLGVLCGHDGESMLFTVVGGALN